MTEKYIKWIGWGSVAVVVTVFGAAIWYATQDAPSEENAECVPADDLDAKCMGDGDPIELHNASSQPNDPYSAST